MCDFGKSAGHFGLVLGGAVLGAGVGQLLGPLGIHLNLREVVALTGAAATALALVGSHTVFRHHQLRSHNHTLRVAVDQRMSRYSSRVAEHRHSKTA